MQKRFGRYFRTGIRSTHGLFVKYRHRTQIESYIKRSYVVIRTNLRIHQSIIALTIFILFSNGIVVQAANSSTQVSSDQVISDPYQIADTVRILKPYIDTGTVNEDPDAIALALEEQVNGTFISTNPLIASQPGQLDQPDETPSPPTQVADSSSPKRTGDTTYTVQIGDTLSGIGTKFNLKVATLQVKNNLDDADSIKPGQQLTIPADDLSDKAIQAAQTRKLASAAFAASSTISAPKTHSYGFIVPIHYTAIAQRLVNGHTGIDYDAPIGTPVYAAASGVVISAQGGWNGGYGNNVLVNIGNGMTLRYAHLSSYNVSAGETVSQGELIGHSGNTGRSTGPHLHFELRVNGVALDPGT